MAMKINPTDFGLLPPRKHSPRPKTVREEFLKPGAEFNVRRGLSLNKAVERLLPGLDAYSFIYPEGTPTALDFKKPSCFGYDYKLTEEEEYKVFSQPASLERNEEKIELVKTLLKEAGFTTGKISTDKLIEGLNYHEKKLSIRVRDNDERKVSEILDTRLIPIVGRIGDKKQVLELIKSK
jgi:hypothetical protein